MPLLKGTSDDIVAENVREMRKAGRPETQAVAAALRMAGRLKLGRHTNTHLKKHKPTIKMRHAPTGGVSLADNDQDDAGEE